MAKKTREERFHELNSFGRIGLGLLIPEGAQIPIPKDWWDCSEGRLKEQIREAVVKVILAMEYPDQPKGKTKEQKEKRREKLMRTDIVKIARRLGITQVERPEIKTLNEYETMGSGLDWDRYLINAILDEEGYPNDTVTETESPTRFRKGKPIKEKSAPLKQRIKRILI